MSADDFGRSFNRARAQQGFKSQEHLDAFYRAYDHTTTCPVCTTVSGSVWTGDGYQPVAARCDEGKRLETESFKY